MPTAAERRRADFIRTEYRGRDPETQALIAALQLAAKSPELSREERQALRQIYIRIVWCDHWHIDFHPDANNQAYAYQRHPTDHPAGHIPKIVKR